MPVRPTNPDYQRAFGPDHRWAKPDYGEVRTARKVTKEEAFQLACMDKGVEPTIRQARKYLAGRNRWAS
jgi:hypothetical protein